jgi:AbrB family looped-hinge helix DNA binding protein
MAIKSAAVIGRVGQRRQIVIPKQIAEQLHLAAGDFVAVEKHLGSIVIKPQRLVDPDDILAPSEDKLLRKAERQIRQGQSVELSALSHELDRTPRRRSRKTA